MEAGGRGVGAAGGGGYCDAQCQGYCCNEMDILESNLQATAMTPHPCKGNSCDKSGCAYNPYAAGQKGFYGPGKTVDTSKVFTVVTVFNAQGGRLSSITRKYIQNGRTMNSGTISNCGSEGTYGGMTGMGQSLGRGSECLLLSLQLFSQLLATLKRTDEA
jgi:cellulase